MNGEHPSQAPTAIDRQFLRDIMHAMNEAFSDDGLASSFAKYDNAWLRWFKRNAKRKAQGR